MSWKWNSLGKQECLNETWFVFYAECTEECSPAVSSPPLTDTAIALTSLCSVEKGSHISSFLFVSASDSMHFYITEVLKWQPKQGIMLESAFQTTSNACIYCRAANCSAGPHKDTFRKSRLQGACTLHNAIPSHAGSRFFSKLNAKPVTAKYSISLGGLGYINLEWGCKVQLMVKNITSLTLPDRLFIKIKNFFESSREDLIKYVGKYHIQEQIC